MEGRNIVIQILLLPFTALYGVGISLRNALYSAGLLKSVTFSVPVIGVGNLSVGGAGKTPHVEYMVELLRPHLQVATLSRGYKRKTKGFKMVGPGDNASSVGDEPYQYFLKYKDAHIAVSESRSLGIPMIMGEHPDTQVILLDDSFQHRSVNPGLNILLTEYDHPYSSDFLLPSGRLREWRSGADRADVVIVTKCPEEIEPSSQDIYRSELGLEVHQQLFFTHYSYQAPYHLFTGQYSDINQFDEVILATAIADISYLLDYLSANVAEVHTMTYEDHHFFTPQEISVMVQQYEQLKFTRKAIVTTEKDATRFMLHKDYLQEKNVDLFVLPIKVAFNLDGQASFNKVVQDFLLHFSV